MKTEGNPMKLSESEKETLLTLLNKHIKNNYYDNEARKLKEKIELQKEEQAGNAEKSKTTPELEKYRRLLYSFGRKAGLLDSSYNELTPTIQTSHILLATLEFDSYYEKH